MMTVATFSLSVYVLPFMKKIYCSGKNMEAKKMKNPDHFSPSITVSRAGSA